MKHPFIPGEVTIDPQSGKLRIGELYVLASRISSCPANSRLYLELPLVRQQIDKNDRMSDEKRWDKYPGARCFAFADGRQIDPAIVTDVTQLDHNIQQLTLVLRHPDVVKRIGHRVANAWDAKLASATEVLAERRATNLPRQETCAPEAKAPLQIASLG
jgi:hypothetical protein